MKPSEQINLIKFLKELLPQEYYAVANDDYVEVHKIDVNDPDNTDQPPHVDVQCKFHF